MRFKNISLIHLRDCFKGNYFTNKSYLSFSMVRHIGSCVKFFDYTML